jgi:RNA polymerase sigma factor (sigma-70 family)
LNVVLMLSKRQRPARGEIDAAALELLTRHGSQILATARRYATTPEDAEDAYQRAFEILLTKAPTTSEEELVPWLKTVVKHEAFALRRQRERHSPVTDDGELGERGTPPAATHDQAERYERLNQGAEALRQLKPQEVRALVLRAEGYSYAEICEVTGWSYTKVNRCLTEGRQALAVRLAGIEGGIECAKLAPLLSALADGEASAEDLALLRPHLKACLSCRARLKAFREAPARVAALVPTTAFLADPGGGPLRGLFESIVGATQHQAAVFGERAHATAELVTGQKVAAVAASAAALAGGGTAIDRFANHDRPPGLATEQVESTPVQEDQPPAVPAPPEPIAGEQPAAEPVPAPVPEPAPPPPPPPAPPPQPATEFTPTGSVPATAAAPAPPVPPAQPAGSAATPAGAPRGGGEFAP